MSSCGGNCNCNCSDSLDSYLDGYYDEWVWFSPPEDSGKTFFGKSMVHVGDHYTIQLYDRMGWVMESAGTAG